MPIAAPTLAKQIGETLWQVLYPEVPGATPPDFSERHLVVNASCVGVWGDRGIAVAQKQDFAAEPVRRIAKRPSYAPILPKSFQWPAT